MATFSNISRLENEYYKRVRRLHQKTSVLTVRRKKRALIIGLFFMVFFWIFGIQIVRTEMVLKETRQAVIKAQNNFSKANDDNKLLTEKIALLNNRNYLDKLIREKYYYMKSNETIYNLLS